MGVKVTINDHTPEIIGALERQLARGMWAVGESAAGHAQDILTDFPRVDTGLLRNSIGHAEDQAKLQIIIGTNVEYAPYIEFGTGIYASNGLGRKTPWMVTPDPAGRGKYKEPFWTSGVKPAHFLRDAITKNTKEYKEIMAESLKH